MPTVIKAAGLELMSPTRSETVESPGVRISCLFITANVNVQDGGFLPVAELDHASLERVGEMNPQPNRVRFEQLMSLGALYPLEDKLEQIKTSNSRAAAEDLVGEEETAVGRY